MSRRLLAAGALACSALSCAASPSAAQVAGAPRAAQSSPASARAVQSIRLPNGVSIRLVPMRTVPVASVAFVLGRGSMHEPAQARGVAGVTAALLREGAGDSVASARADALASLGLLGGDVAVEVSEGETAFSGSALSGSAGRLVRLLATMIAEPRFDSASLARVAARLARQADVPPTAATRGLDLADSLIYGTVPLGRARAGDITRLTPRVVEAFWRTAYDPRHLTVIVTGVFDSAAVVGAARDALGRWAPADAAAGGAVTPPVARACRDTAPLTIYALHRAGASQSRLTLAFPVPDPDTTGGVALQQLNALLGGVQTSRIVANVRERHGYSYNVGSRLTWRPGASRWVVSADVATPTTGAALREILSELTRVTSAAAPADEISRFQAFTEGTIRADNVTPMGLQRTLRWQTAFGVSPRYLDDLHDTMRRTTPEQLRQLAAELLRPACATVVVTGDLAVIESDLAGIGVVRRVP